MSDLSFQGNNHDGKYEIFKKNKKETILFDRRIDRRI